ncbi:hypothetical protein Bhyg_13953 [Pseudolycoriella hygida]|uniref:Uncharacterized protein n=1 Tax=Pseudolycoriella hygida TaxID=35572 RepID=A0A9Q0RWZ3_9DIPT|nr:hypothetical protein Bhyg_13953 [Pseudolycoriella hygida]
MSMVGDAIKLKSVSVVIGEFEDVTVME